MLHNIRLLHRVNSHVFAQIWRMLNKVYSQTAFKHFANSTQHLPWSRKHKPVSCVWISTGMQLDYMQQKPRFITRNTSSFFVLHFLRKSSVAIVDVYKAILAQWLPVIAHAWDTSQFSSDVDPVGLIKQHVKKAYLACWAKWNWGQFEV